jgi:hypothetical protein
VFSQQLRSKGVHVGIAQQLDQTVRPFRVNNLKDLRDRERGLVCFAHAFRLFSLTPG